MEKAAMSSPLGGKTSPGRGKMSRKRQKGVMASECETERVVSMQLVTVHNQNTETCAHLPEEIIIFF